MTNTVLTIQDLRDIAEPPAVGLFPVNGIVTALLILLGIALVFIAVISVLCWRQNAYRRVALKLLELAESNDEINILLKRVALAAWPREEVASLYGEEWLDFLNANCDRVTFAKFEPQLKKQAALWIQHHRRPAC